MYRLALCGFALVVTVVACSGNNDTCRTCPPVEGNWSMIYAAPAPACANARTPPATLSITRIGSIVRSNLDGTTLSGTAFDTFDFTLRGDIGDLLADAGNPPGRDGGSRLERVEIRARFIPGSGDGGQDRLSGTWELTPAFSTCIETREFSGTRQ